MQIATSVPGVEQVRLARAELDQWCEYALRSLEQDDPQRAAVYGPCYAQIPLSLRERISEALMTCQTPLEARILFASIQDHQLCADS